MNPFFKNSWLRGILDTVFAPLSGYHRGESGYGEILS
jgi:hypothetical protein